MQVLATFGELFLGIFQGYSMQMLRIKLKATINQLNGIEVSLYLKKAAHQIRCNTVFAFSLAMIALCCAIWLIAIEDDDISWFRLNG